MNNKKFREELIPKFPFAVYLIFDKKSTAYKTLLPTILLSLHVHSLPHDSVYRAVA
jgi:hypothetical protein